MSQPLLARLLSFVGVGRRRSCVSDELISLLSRCERDHSEVFLFGGQLQAVYALRDILYNDLPNLKISGICDGEFQDMPSVEVMTAILRCRPDVVIIDLDRRCTRVFLDFYNSHAPGGISISFAGAFDQLVRRKLGSKSMSIGLYPDFCLGRVGRAIAFFANFVILMVDQKLQGGRYTIRRPWIKNF